jgi:hypothetical protein
MHLKILLVEKSFLAVYQSNKHFDLRIDVFLLSRLLRLKSS